MNKLFALCFALLAAAAVNAQTFMMVETKDGTYRFDINQVDQVYFETKTVEKEVIEPFVGQTNIYSDAKIGDSGLIDGQEVVVVQLNDTKLAMATCNYGASIPVLCGKYLNYKTVRAANTDHLWGEGWRLPMLAEMSTLMYDENMEIKNMSQVSGCMWYIGQKRTQLFFPMAGEMSTGELTGYGEVGYYWTSDMAGDGAWCMGVQQAEETMDATFFANAYTSDLLSVRLVCDLKDRPKQ